MGDQSQPTSGAGQTPAPSASTGADQSAPEGGEATEALPAEAIEAQVDALLDQAQQQVQTMSELVNDPTPEDALDGAAPDVADMPMTEPGASEVPSDELDADTLAAMIAEHNAAKVAAAEAAAAQPAAAVEPADAAPQAAETAPAQAPSSESSFDELDAETLDAMVAEHLAAKSAAAEAQRTVAAEAAAAVSDIAATPEELDAEPPVAAAPEVTAAPEELDATPPVAEVPDVAPAPDQEASSADPVDDLDAEPIVAVDTAAPAAADEERVEPASGEQVSEDTIEPLDTDALQSQVDAILAEATQVTESDENEPLADSSSTPDSLDVETPPPTAAGSEPAAEVDLASVDAVIADAAQRALDEDDFETGDPGRDVAPEPGRAPVVATASTPAPPATPRPELVPKGGDKSMRREKPRPVRLSVSDSRLDGDPPPTPVQVPKPVAPTPREEPSWLRTFLFQTTPRLAKQAADPTLRCMAVLNSPWKSWSPSTRKAIMAITCVNIVLAVGAYYVLLRRWI